MKRRNLLKSCLIAAPIGLIIWFFAPVRVRKSKSSDCPDEDESPFCEDPTCPYSSSTNTAEPPEETYHWINRGCYKGLEGVEEWHCCYTRKDGRRMCLLVLCEIDDVEETKKITEKRRRAVKGGAWYPTDKTVYKLL